MAKVFVHGGQCEKETLITARKSTPTECSLEFETTCEHIAGLAEDLKEVNAGGHVPSSGVTPDPAILDHLAGRH